MKTANSPKVTHLLDGFRITDGFLTFEMLGLPPVQKIPNYDEILRSLTNNELTQKYDVESFPIEENSQPRNLYTDQSVLKSMLGLDYQEKNDWENENQYSLNDQSELSLGPKKTLTIQPVNSTVIIEPMDGKPRVVIDTHYAHSLFEPTINLVVKGEPHLPYSQGIQFGTTLIEKAQAVCDHVKNQFQLIAAYEAHRPTVTSILQLEAGMKSDLTHQTKFQIDPAGDAISAYLARNE